MRCSVELVLCWIFIVQVLGDSLVVIKPDPEPQPQPQPQSVSQDDSLIVDIVYKDSTSSSSALNNTTKQSTVTPFTEVPTSTNESRCGIRNMGGISFRISTEPDGQAFFGEFPWMIAVLQKNYTENNEEINMYHAGGALIHPSIVLTAAHRVSGVSSHALRVRGGEWDTATKFELLPHQDRDVAQVVIHDSFDLASLRNDVALLFLTSPMDLADHIRPVCLPPLDSNFDFRRCVATGWGKDAFTINARYSTLLKAVDLPIVPLQECQSLLRTTRLSKYFELHDSFVCAGGEEGKDSCTGDGGSPLVCSTGPSSNQYYQIGIVAWGIGCGSNNIPGVYSNVAKFRGWIDKIVTEKGLSIDSYTAQ